jgi:hypothetical protein
VLSPHTLSPFFGSSVTDEAWQTAILDLLAYIPNVIILSEAQGKHVRMR